MPSIRVEVRPDGVAVLTFDQAGGKANILTRALWEEFDAALAATESRPDVRGLVLASGKPDVFIAGADLKFLAAVPAPNDPAVRELIEFGLRVLDRLERLPFPTCAAIDGAALGGGLEVALACDFRVVGTNPRIELGLPEVKLGLIPGWGGTQRLPRIIPIRCAAEMLWSGRSWDIERASDYSLVMTEGGSAPPVDRAAGLLLNLLPTDWLERRMAKRCPVPEWEREEYEIEAPNFPPAEREVLTVLKRGAGLPLAEAIKLETEAFLRLAGSDGSKRLIAEFFAARKRG